PRLAKMRVMVDAHLHVGVRQGAVHMGQQIGQIHGAGVRGALGHGENEVTIPRTLDRYRPVSAVSFPASQPKRMKLLSYSPMSATKLRGRARHETGVCVSVSSTRRL